jgi:hypothetical protein
MFSEEKIYFFHRMKCDGKRVEGRRTSSGRSPCADRSGAEKKALAGSGIFAFGKNGLCPPCIAGCQRAEPQGLKKGGNHEEKNKPETLFWEWEEDEKCGNRKNRTCRNTDG